MMMKRLCVLVFLLSIPANASDSIQSLKNFCVQYIPSKHLAPADYVPHIDVRGNNVVPADLEHSRSQFINDPIIIPIEIEIIEQFGLDLPVGTDLEPIVAQVEIGLDGRTLINGKDVTKSVYQICDQHLDNKQNQTEQDGHESHVPVILPVKQIEEKDRIDGQFPSQSSSAE